MPIKGCGVKGACQEERGDEHHRHIIEVPHDRGGKIAFHGVFQQDIQKPSGEKRGDNLQIASNFNVRAAQMHGEPPGDAARARQNHQSRRARRAASRQTEEADFRRGSQLDDGEHGPKDKGDDGPCRHYPPLERVCSACTAHPSSLSSSHDPLLSKYTLSALSNDGRAANRAAFFWPHGLGGVHRPEPATGKNPCTTGDTLDPARFSFASDAKHTGCRFSCRISS